MTATAPGAATDRTALIAEVVEALSASPRTLPPKLFYDERGAALFERICELEEYYLTRTELRILAARAAEIARLAGAGAALIEYGSGAGTKVRLLLDALDAPAAYVPIDISHAQLRTVARGLQRRYHGLRVVPLTADFTQPLRLPRLPAPGRTVAFFPGSTLGNFHPEEAAVFLRRVRATIGRDGLLVLGIDRPKAAAVLEAAYDDAEGVTAAFNRNILAHVNRACDATFAVDAFAHVALWNAAASRVEMHLEATRALDVRVGDRRFRFTAGDRIWTESSYKYDEASLRRLALAGGLAVHRLWSDPEERFWVAVLGGPPGP